MGAGGIVIAAVDAVARESMLFAAIGFLIGGLDDFAIDGVFLAVWARRRLRRVDIGDGFVADYPVKATPRCFAVFVPAWDEAPVIGAMLRTTLARYESIDYRLYVGTYPNDRPTIDAVAAVAETDGRVRLVIGQDDGPTTKADCLNTLWHALKRDEAAGSRQAAAIVQHDAEDVVHPQELRIYDALLDRYSVVQLPVLPLIDRRARLVSGHYADEFAEAHAKNLLVRQALGAGIPLAGVGCCIARETLETLSQASEGKPFDSGSITEDYELGLTLSRLGADSVIARVRERAGGPLVAVRAYFPSTVATSVRQKARWMTGIALAGWDRIGWAPAHDLAEHWMRMRDRRAPFAVLILAVAYIALVVSAGSALAHWIAATPRPRISGTTARLLEVNAALLIWRMMMRVAFTTRDYGWIEGLWSLPRALVGNFIALVAVRRAVWHYARLLRGADLHWDKTAHVFPEASALET
ncbi:glycosyl transferase family protein [Sphingomonas sp. GC_Shp_3]|uniref:glycosyl transferase family protein n=1 Tax=Sphingomonas sp. GC_Shp_3 TaxID=2937383 RepID=UPI00226A1A78|nr:glycosyl transferase family protein [Sphingomonas sp. GC_Shp_3]